MSSNPFRRKITEPPSTSIPANPATGTAALSINTGARPEKHVRIASPPDTQISPASYPSSPEFARLSSSLPATVGLYSFHVASPRTANDPFTAADSSGDDDDEVVSEALKNTRLNIAASRVPPAAAPAPSEDAVQNTLSKFASRPRDVKPQVSETATAPPKQDTKRQTMDVDAFTRLLLTGGGSTPGPAGGTSSVSTTAPPNTLSESSSTADSASISRQSIFEPMPPIAAESPRTSHELDETDASTIRRAVSSAEAPDNVKKPPPAPRPRHGKLIKPPQTVPSASTTSPEPRSPTSDLNKPLPLPPPPASASDSSRRGSASSTSIVGSGPSMQTKRPPTPPLSRRRSQGPNKPPLSRSSPSLQSITTISQAHSSSSSLSQAPKPIVPPPLPPPSRRASQRMSENKGSNLPSTSEEKYPDLEAGAGSSGQGPDLSKPILPRLSRTTSAATRASTISTDTAPPPLPPPRRHRGSSNASQRPILSTANAGPAPVQAVDSSRSSISIEGPRPALEQRTEEGPSRDILKHLATLQAEVDALRRQGLRE